MRISKAVLSSAVALVILAVSAPAPAGYSAGYQAHVTTYSDGSGSAWGTLDAFTKSSDPNANAFVEIGAGFAEFYGEVSGGAGGCGVQFPANGPIPPEWSALLAGAQNTYFQIYWDANAHCTVLYTGQFSYYQ
jgi:hypothetical protein